MTQSWKISNKKVLLKTKTFYDLFFPPRNVRSKKFDPLMLLKYDRFFLIVTNYFIVFIVYNYESFYIHSFSRMLEGSGAVLNLRWISFIHTSQLYIWRSSLQRPHILHLTSWGVSLLFLKVREIAACTARHMVHLFLENIQMGSKGDVASL